MTNTKLTIISAILGAGLYLAVLYSSLVIGVLMFVLFMFVLFCAITDPEGFKRSQEERRKREGR